MILKCPEVVFVILTLIFRCVIASCEWDLGVGLCCRRRLDFDFSVSRGWFRFFTFRCPEVGSEFSFCSVQASYLSRRWRLSLCLSASLSLSPFLSLCASVSASLCLSFSLSLSLSLSIQWILFVSWFLVSSFYIFSILRIFLLPLDSFFFSGLCGRTSFLVKTIAQNVWCGFRFCAIVLSSSMLVSRRGVWCQGMRVAGVLAVRVGYEGEGGPALRETRARKKR